MVVNLVLRITRSRILTFLAFSLIFFIGFGFENQAFGHGCQSMMTSRDLRMEDEVFSKQTISVGETLQVQGVLVNLDMNAKELKPWAVITISDEGYWIDDFMRVFSGPSSSCPIGTSDGHVTWYFKIETKPQEIFLKPEGVNPYQITLTPLKAGTYHIHSAMYWNNLYWTGPGQTIIVQGDHRVTDGEIFGFYLPFISGIIGIIFASILGFKGMRRLQTNQKSKGKLP